MRVRAQMSMVMNLDKCIGCHTCSVTCKQVWTNRPGTEYVWFNNVETAPGQGYPRRWSDQARCLLSNLFCPRQSLQKGFRTVKSGQSINRLSGCIQNIMNAVARDRPFDLATVARRSTVKLSSVPPGPTGSQAPSSRCAKQRSQYNRAGT